MGEAIKDLKSLKTLTLSDTGGRYRTLWLSPGDQHSFVHPFPTKFHNTYNDRIQSMDGLAFAHPHSRNGECHCELELLSSKNICEELRRLAQYDDPLYVSVRD